MSPKKIVSKKKKAFKKVENFVKDISILDKIKINPENIIKNTQSKIGKIYTKYKKDREKEKIRSEKRKKIEEKKKFKDKKN